MTGNTRRSALVVALSIVTLVAAGAGDAGPRSPKAKAAIRAYDRALDGARAEYGRAVAAAGKALRAELDESLKQAMKAGSLDEANSIKAVRESRVPGSGATTFEGAWSVVYGNAVKRTYVIRSNRIAITEDGRQWQGELRIKGGVILADVTDHQGPKLERFTVAGPRFFIEHWHPAGAYPDGIPEEFGVAVRATATRDSPK